VILRSLRLFEIIDTPIPNWNIVPTICNMFTNELETCVTCEYNCDIENEGLLKATGSYVHWVTSLFGLVFR